MPGVTELHEFAQALAVSGGFARYSRRRFRIRPWVDELGHR